MRLAVAITAFTSAGALGGGIAWPSTSVAPQVALVLGALVDGGVQL